MLFKDKLKELRESRNLLQRQVAASLDVDTATYCKFEKGERQVREELIQRLSFFYGVPYEELHRCWLADKVFHLIGKENDADGILCMVAEEMVKYGKYRNGYGKD